jgi:hypothetical protein
MNDKIKRQIELLEEEQFRAKEFLNNNNFDCTSAPWVLVRQYRDSIKAHIKVLRLNLEEQ